MESIKSAEEITSKFLVDANEAVNFRLVRSAEELANPKNIFHPGMCHHVFGPQENIFGYSNLNVNLFYTAGKLTQFYFKTFDETIAHDVGGVEPDNIEEKLTKWEILQQENSATNQSHFEDIITKDRKFRPYGQKIGEIKRGEKTFELFKASMSDPGFREWYLRLETFIMWFVDGAQYIDTDDSQWDYYVMFEKYQNKDTLDFSYAVAGFCTVFRFYAYPERIRPRVSQILMLPPFQKMGLGSEMLKAITSQYQMNEVLEITMEDPSPEIQRVRDFNDVNSCVNLREFSPERLRNGFHLAMYSAACDAAKINRKQARRVYEILRLRSTPQHDTESMRQYRIDVKNRLNSPYKNDALRKMRINIPSGVKLGDDERKKLLQQEFEEVMQQYTKVIERMEKGHCNTELKN